MAHVCLSDFATFDLRERLTGSESVDIGFERAIELGVLTHAITVCADIDEVTVVQDSVDECNTHNVVAKHFTPLLEALARYGFRPYTAR